jgi:hypothetical protein
MLRAKASVAGKCYRHSVARQLNAISLPAIAMLLQPGLWGSELTWALERYGNMAGLIAVGEDMPRETNAITLHPNRVDKFGVPLAVVKLR